MIGTTARDHRFARKAATQYVNCSDVIKYMMWDNRCATPEGKTLAVILATMVDPQEHTGAIIPGDDRLLALTGWAQDRLEAAIDDLKASWQWRVITDVQGGVRLFLPLFLGDVATNKDRLKSQVKGSMDHNIRVFRYSGLPADMRWIIGVVASTMRLNYNPLGSEGRHYTYRSPISRRKVVVGALFDHPIMEANSPEGWDELFHTTTVPDDIRSRSTNLSLAWLADRAGIDSATLSYLLFEPQDYFHVQPENDGTVTFTPTRSFHQAVWELNRNAGGPDRNAWEVTHGFFPAPAPVATSDQIEDAYWCAPPLGEHWVYEIYIGDAVLQVGETTQPLSTRLRQHILKPTNDFAELHLTQHMGQGVIPSIRAVARAHNYTVNHVEMAHLRLRVAQGHHLFNYLVSTATNAETIKLDSRYDGWSRQAVTKHLQNTYWADQEFYERQLAEAEWNADAAEHTGRNIAYTSAFQLAPHRLPTAA